RYPLDGHNWDVLSSPPPSSGGVAMIEALNMLKNVPLKGWDDLESVHVVAETMRRVFADRAAYLADPDFAKVPVDGLTSPCYAKEIRATINPRQATSSKEIGAGQPHVCGTEASIAVPQEISANDVPHTTHFSVVDAAGNGSTGGDQCAEVPSSVVPGSHRGGESNFAAGAERADSNGPHDEKNRTHWAGKRDWNRRYNWRTSRCGGSPRRGFGRGILGACG